MSFNACCLSCGGAVQARKLSIFATHLLTDRPMQKNRLFIVSNRLPLTIEKSDGGYSTRPSSGGLVSAITGFLKKNGRNAFSEAFWAGVPGCSEKTWNAVINDMGSIDYGLLPV